MKIFSDEDFDPVFYTSFYPDLRHLGRWRAAAHWKRHGKSEGRWPCEAAALAALRAHPDLPRDFNPQQYLHLNQDVADAIGTEAGAMKHYLDHGRHENRRFRVFSPALRLFKAGDTTACAAQKTVIVGGTMRGGTSMVAGAVMGLGVHMGTSLDVNVEDPAFNIHRSDCEDRQEFVETLKQEIAKRNARHDVWGWKFPGVASYLEEVVDLLRAPRLVFVFRDPVAIAHRKVRPGSKANNTKLALENMAGNRLCCAKVERGIHLVNPVW